jgi:hypothetical protein
MNRPGRRTLAARDTDGDVPSSEPPRSDREPNVTSLVDRLPPARRAKLLARIALEAHLSSGEQLTQRGFRVPTVRLNSAALRRTQKSA